MLGEPGADGAELLETDEGSALGSGTADVDVPQLLSTTARARTGIRAPGTTRTRMEPRVPALPGRTVSKPRVSAGSPTVEGVSFRREGRMGVSRMQPGMPDLAQIVLKAQQMGDAVQRAQAALAEQSFTGTMRRQSRPRRIDRRR